MTLRFRWHSEPSKPELQMRSILDNLHVSYEYQWPVRSGFVLDFALLDKMRAIEVDGPFHDFDRDKFRDSILKKAGWTILRVPMTQLSNPEMIMKVMSFVRGL